TVAIRGVIQVWGWARGGGPNAGRPFCAKATDPPSRRDGSARQKRKLCDVDLMLNGLFALCLAVRR
ncbi:MAG TPA: hypothetical protein DCX13_11935, partial [Rhodobacteraceae bacterium]|nr:hypothetical protein [Paracoccaceae bacterium]